MHSNTNTSSEENRRELLFLLDYFHEYNYDPNTSIEYVLTVLRRISTDKFSSVQLRALANCEELLRDSAETEALIKQFEKGKKLKLEASLKMYVHV